MPEHEFTMRRRVEFSETDMAGILHFANYFRYMEEVEHAFFRSLGKSVHVRDGDRTRGFARGRAACDYRRPLTYEDEVELHLLVKEVRDKSVTYVVRFVLDGEEVARGEHVAVCVQKGPGDERMRAVTIPEDIASRLAPAPAGLLADG